MTSFGPHIPPPGALWGPVRLWTWIVCAILILAAVPHFFVQYWFNSSLGFRGSSRRTSRQQALLFLGFGAAVFLAIRFRSVSMRPVPACARAQRCTSRSVAGLVRRLARRKALPELSCWRRTACPSGGRIRSSATTSASTSTGCPCCNWRSRAPPGRSGSASSRRSSPATTRCARSGVARVAGSRPARRPRCSCRPTCGGSGTSKARRRRVPVPAALRPAVQGQRGVRRPPRRAVRRRDGRVLHAQLHLREHRCRARPVLPAQPLDEGHVSPARRQIRRGSRAPTRRRPRRGLARRATPWSGNQRGRLARAGPRVLRRRRRSRPRVRQAERAVDPACPHQRHIDATIAGYRLGQVKTVEWNLPRASRSTRIDCSPARRCRTRRFSRRGWPTWKRRRTCSISSG